MKWKGFAYFLYWNSFTYFLAQLISEYNIFGLGSFINRFYERCFNRR